MHDHDQGGHGAHPPHLQHHFDTSEQQFDSAKLGMWLFLATEILLFGGLFVAYAVYRGNHPEIFMYAHHFLDTNLGALNTVVLLCSSLTMAWGVRAAQLGQRQLLAVLLGLTLLGGGTFMVVKYFEYKAKFQHGLLWARQYDPHHEDGGHGAGDHDAAGHDAAPGAEGARDGDAGHDPAADHGGADHDASHDGDPHAAPAAPAPATTGSTGPGTPVAAARPAVERTMLAGAGPPPEGLVPPAEPGHGASQPGPEPRNVQIFFSIYFLMTGLHGLHVLLGMGAIFWLLVKSLGGAFGPEYFTPVDLVGLYWHLVDLIWIFLFPLLYLIH